MGCFTRVSREVCAAWYRLDETFSICASIGCAGLTIGFQIVRADTNNAIATAQIPATKRRLVVVACRINAANTKPNIPLEKVTNTVPNSAVRALRRNHSGRSASRLETIADAKMQKLDNRFG